MVQNYLANVRRAVQRMTNLIDNRRQPAGSSAPRQSPEAHRSDDAEVDLNKLASRSQSILESIEAVELKMSQFSSQFSELMPRQQSPLIDRIPPRGVELWRDFWDTVRRQVRRINQEFYQLSRDMSRMLTGRLPGGPPAGTPFTSVGVPRQDGESLLYSSQSITSDQDQAASTTRQFQEFYDKMSSALSEQQRRMSSFNRAGVVGDNVAEKELTGISKMSEQVNLIDEQDDQTTRDELNRNVALRQQIQQDISIFGSIFDIMRAFIQRLRESTTSMVRDVVRPGASNNNNNDPVTPGPSVKPQVDQLLGETINSQRIINSQGKPVLLPNNRLVAGQSG